MPVKDFSVNLSPINGSSTFSNGDQISGQVTFKETKETRIKSLFVKAKGKASVFWTERYGQYTTVVYRDKETCFKSAHYFVAEQKNEGKTQLLLQLESMSTLSPFIFPIGTCLHLSRASMEKIAYYVEAKLCRKLHVSKKAKIQINYVLMGVLCVSESMIPQYASIEKKMSFLTSGSVAMNIYTEKMGYQLGEVLKVRIAIENNSSRSIRPTVCLYQKQSHFAMNKRKVYTKTVLKEHGNSVNPSTKQSVTKELNIPADISPSILNCKVLKVEYRLKVYLDVKFTSDPEIKMPILLLLDSSRT